MNDIGHAQQLPPGASASKNSASKRWSLENAADAAAIVMLQRNQHTLDLAVLLTPPTLNTGFDEHFREFGAHLGLARWQFEKYAIIGWALAKLPLLRNFLHHRPILNFDHLRHIADTVFPLDDDILITEIDLNLAEWVEPRLDNQALPTPRALLNHLKRVMEELSPLYRPIDYKEKVERAEQTRAGEYHVDERGEDTSTFYLTLAKADAELITSAVNKLSARDGLSKAQALLSLVTETASISATLHLYANADVPMIWAERIGWLTPHLAQPLLSQVTQVVSEAAAPQTTTSYAPTQEQLRYVRARDGSCRAPGCEVPAHRCQIDHIIPFDAGGATDVANLHCLCTSHHQLKTNRYAHLIMAFSGVQAWANNDDDTLTYTVPSGPLSKHFPMLEFGHIRDARAERIVAHNERRAAATGSHAEAGAAERDAEAGGPGWDTSTTASTSPESETKFPDFMSGRDEPPF